MGSDRASLGFRRRIAGATILVAVAVAAATSAMAAGPADGKYSCYTYAGGRANHVGGLTLKGNTYTGFPSEKGKYRFDEKTGVVVFGGPPPLQFKVAVLEIDPKTQVGRLRLYREKADIGKKTKALLCSPAK